jgi:prepilin-type N-terminal cleavage/methylation domain-containing protein
MCQLKKKNSSSAQYGMTLVELLVAMVVGSIVLFGVFYSWTTINTYVAKSKYKTELESETNRIGSLVASRIRKSPQILEWSENRVQMISPAGADTLDYYFNQNDLLLNGQPVQILVHDAKVKVFALNNLNEVLSNSDNSLLLDFIFTIEGRESDSATVHYTIQLSQTSKKNEGSGAWGF